MTFLLATLVLLAVLAWGWQLSARDPGQDLRRLQARLRTSTPAGTRAGAHSERTGAGLLRSDRMSDIPALQQWLAHWAPALRLKRWLQQAGTSMTAGKFLLISAAIAAGAGLIASIFTPWFSVTVVVLLAAWLPAMWVARRRHRRLETFRAQLPEALDMFVRASQAGHPPAAVLELVANEMPQPLAGEFQQVWEEQHFGLPMRDCWLHLAERVPLVDVQFLATTMIVQRESGGNLAEILEKLAHVMRERVKLKREVNTHTAQGRMTTRVLVALAPVMLVAMLTISPEFTRPLFTDPLGRTMLMVGVVLQVVGLVWLRRIVDIKV